MIPRALGFRDLSLHLLAPLPLPAIHQFVEGFKESGASGHKIPFYHNLGEPGNYSRPFPQTGGHPLGPWGGAGFCIESAERLVNIPAFGVQEDFRRRQGVQRRNPGGIFLLEKLLEHLLFHAPDQPRSPALDDGGPGRGHRVPRI